MNNNDTNGAVFLCPLGKVLVLATQSHTHVAVPMKAFVTWPTSMVARLSEDDPL